MTDESTDIVVHHKLCITARIVDPVTLTPSTMFLIDLRITSATGAAIFDAIKSHLSTRNIDISKVTGLGTDGASVMTGRKNGLTGHFLQENPMLINTHCSAHRLALCTEQAAQKIPAMKYYQETLESIFYYFKKSADRCDKVEAVQRVLNDPVLKYREVHQVRWLSFYQALDAVYQTLDSLISYFSTATDSKAAGLKQRICEDFLLNMTYAMMDILAPVMRLNLFFQGQDVDIGTVQIMVETCMKDLEALSGDPPATSYLSKAGSDIQDHLFMGQHVVKTSKYKFSSAKNQFVQTVIDNINKRFPDTEILSSMCVLGMRPVTLLGDDELEDWGNNSINILIDHFGQPKTHKYVTAASDDTPSMETSITSDALIDPEKTRTRMATDQASCQASGLSPTFNSKVVGFDQRVSW